MSKVFFCLPMLLLSLSGPLSAQVMEGADAEALLAELDAFLTPSNMRKLLQRKQIDVIYRMAQEEDMAWGDEYLISNQLLQLLHKRGILNTPFGALMERLQEMADELPADQKAELTGRWRSLWLDKTSEFVRHQKAQRRVWTFDYSHSFDYDSNVALDPTDNTKSRYADKDAVGLSNDIGFAWRPFVNHLKSWDIQLLKLSYGTREQSRIKSTLSDSVTAATSVGYDFSDGVFQRIGWSQRFLSSYSKNPANKRHDFRQLSESLNFDLRAWKIPSAYFNRTQMRLNLGYNNKDDFRDVRVATSVSDDSDAFNATLSQNFSRLGGTYQDLGWSLRYENQSTQPTRSRDFSNFNFGVHYARSVKASWISSNPLQWRSTIDVRNKDWDNAVAASAKDEFQYQLGTSLRASWSTNWSTRLALSWMAKDQDLQGGGSLDVEQFRASITNTFLTF